MLKNMFCPFCRLFDCQNISNFTVTKTKNVSVKKTVHFLHVSSVDSWQFLFQEMYTVYCFVFHKNDSDISYIRYQFLF